MDLVLHYEPHLVRLPGVEDDAEVRARIVDLTAGQILNKGAPNNQDGDGDHSQTACGPPWWSTVVSWATC